MTNAPSTSNGNSNKAGQSNLKKYSWKEVEQHKNHDDIWIVVKGKVYDVTSWIPKHPGGVQMLLSNGGREATAAFVSYHPLYVQNKLEQYLIGEVSDYNAWYKWDSTDFYPVVKGRVEKHMKENNLEGESWEMYLKTFLVLAFWAVAYYYTMIRGYVLCTFILGFFHAHYGISISHDGCHGSYSKKHQISYLARLAMDLMGGSSLVWYMQHNIGHHPHSNKFGEIDKPIEYDPDTRSGIPLIRFTPFSPWKPWHRFQHLYIWILFLFVTARWFVNDFRTIARRKYQTLDFFEISQFDLKTLYCTKALFILYAGIIPLSLHSVPKVLLITFIYVAVSSYYFVLMFNVNHLTDDSHFPQESSPTRDWASLQVMTATNFCHNSLFWNWMSGSLNLQIEHHLFPGVCHTKLRYIQPIVEKTCKEYGLPYTSFPSYWAAFVSHYRLLKSLGEQPTEAQLKKVQ
jgi:fatty acid desaturase/cytochrome b involved in lipid metabolism